MNIIKLILKWKLNQNQSEIQLPGISRVMETDYHETNQIEMNEMIEKENPLAEISRWFNQYYNYDE